MSCSLISGILSSILIYWIYKENSFNPKTAPTIETVTAPTITKAWNDLSLFHWTISTPDGLTIRRTFPSLIHNSEIIDEKNNVISYTKWSHKISRNILDRTGKHMFTLSPAFTSSNIQKHILTGVVNSVTDDWITQPEWIGKEFEIYVKSENGNNNELTKVGMIYYYQIGIRHRGFGATLESSCQIVDLNGVPIVTVGRSLLAGPMTYNIVNHNTSHLLANPHIVGHAIAHQSFAQFTRSRSASTTEDSSSSSNTESIFSSLLNKKKSDEKESTDIVTTIIIFVVAIAVAIIVALSVAADIANMLFGFLLVVGIVSFTIALLDFSKRSESHKQKIF